MKQIFCLALVLLVLLCGCTKEDSVIFYYRPVDYLNDHDGSILAPETRNVTGYRENPHFLISLYLTGPLDQDLESPFPAGSKLQSLLINGNEMTIQLYELPQNLSDAEFSLACACLTMTCIGFSNADSVTVICGNRSVTLDQSMLILSDIPVPTQTTPGGSS